MLDYYWAVPRIENAAKIACIVLNRHFQIGSVPTMGASQFRSIFLDSFPVSPNTEVISSLIAHPYYTQRLKYLRMSRQGILAQDAKRGGRISAVIFDRRATKSCAKRTAARRVVQEMAAWLRCSSVADRCGYAPSSRLAIQPFPEQRHAQLFKTLCIEVAINKYMIRGVRAMGYSPHLNSVERCSSVQLRSLV